MMKRRIHQQEINWAARLVLRDIGGPRAFHGMLADARGRNQVEYAIAIAQSRLVHAGDIEADLPCFKVHWPHLGQPVLDLPYNYMQDPAAPFMTSAVVLIECPVTGSVLSVSRRDNYYSMSLPGGHVECSESPLAGALRELREETGIVLAIGAQVKEVYWRERCATYKAFMQDVDYTVPKEPNGGRVAWVSWRDLIDGPFGSYNQRLHDLVHPEGR